MRRPDGSVQPVAESARGTALGLMPGREYQETAVAIEPGDVCLAYTDGFTEARAPESDEEFGVARLCAVLGGPRTALPLDQCAAEASAAVRRFTGQDELQDDQTLLLIRR